MHHSWESHYCVATENQELLYLDTNTIGIFVAIWMVSDPFL